MVFTISKKFPDSMLMSFFVCSMEFSRPLGLKTVGKKHQGTWHFLISVIMTLNIFLENASSLDKTQDEYSAKRFEDYPTNCKW